jgi:hypothetical protein
MATVSDDLIRSYVEQNKANPEVIATAANMTGLSKIDLMRATGYSNTEIDAFFNASNVKPAAATAEQRTATASQLGLDATVSQMRAAGITEAEVNSYLDKAAIEVAQSQVNIANENKRFTTAQAELEAMSQQEMAIIRQQQADYESAQRRLAEQAAAQAEAARQEQERLAAEAAAYQKQAEEKAAQIKRESEDFERTTAERDVARKRVGRSTVARPLLAGASMPDRAQTLGVGGGMATGQALGATGTLGVGG